MVRTSVAHMQSLLVLANLHQVAALPPQVPYEPFWEVGEQSGFDVVVPIQRWIPQLSAGSDLVLRPKSSKVEVIAGPISSYFHSSGTTRLRHAMKVEAHYVVLADEPVLVTVPGGVLVNDTRSPSSGGVGMTTTHGLVKPVKIFPGQQRVKFEVFLEPVPSDGDPYRRYAPRDPIRPWFELQSDYDRRTNVPDGAFDWAHVLRLSSYLDRQQVKFRDVHRAYVKEVVDDAFSGYSAAAKSSIMSKWEEYLEDSNRPEGPKYLWHQAFAAVIEWSDANRESHQEVEDADTTELWQVRKDTCDGLDASVDYLPAASLHDGQLATPPISSRILDPIAVVVLVCVIFTMPLTIKKVCIARTSEKADANENDTVGSDRNEAMKKKRPTRRGRGTLRKAFQEMADPPGQYRSKEDTVDAVSIPDTASELFYPQLT